MPESTPSSLSNDVRLLGNLLGQVIREQHGDEAFQLVESVRHLAKARRSGDQSTTEQMMAIFGRLSIQEKLILVKAFSNYFQLINIAEDQERIRVLRARETRGPLSESIDEAIRILHGRGANALEMRKLLDQLRLRFVLTAHPSEAKRNEVLLKLRAIARMMMQRDREHLLEREHRLLEERLAEEIEELWQTRAVRATEKQVDDEVEFGIYFMTSAIMEVVVEIYDDFYACLETYYPGEQWVDLHRLLRYGSWIGGDRDGNPNVTPEVTLRTLKRLRDATRRVYLDELRNLIDHLTQATDETGSSAALSQIEAPSGLVLPRYNNELYREKLEIIWHKLERDLYKDRLDLLDELRLIQNSLREHRGQRVAEGKLRRLMRRVRLFGLYLTPLDIREDARLHAQALEELFARYGVVQDYRSIPEKQKQAILTREIANPRPLFPRDTSSLSDVTQRVIATWSMIPTAYALYGTSVIDCFIASMSQQPSDVLALLLFAREAGIDEHIDLVPLFETIDDLEAAPAIMRTLFHNEHYVAHLQKRAMRQQIMIGYSDSSKDGGYIASNWHLYQAQEQLATACAECGISVELFHGRGGSIGRGGGPTNRAILSQPPQSLRGGIKITEQGEVIAYRYSNPEIARRHLHQVLNAVIRALGEAQQNRGIEAEWAAAMEELSETGRRAYRSLVYETDGFLEYWQAATPINELSRLRISSRPAKRSSKGGFAAMRAIPWVFSWMQNRAIIPSWFGVGSAFEAFCEVHENGLVLLQSMYRDWGFFNALVENTQLDVAKADMGIAELYASLVPDEAIREAIFGRIRAEHERTERMICAITGQQELLDSSSAIKNSIERRNPYVDPLNLLQVALLRELRGLDEADPNYTPILEAVLATINGIAAGMKTTG